jgi:hypothetical protein
MYRGYLRILQKKAFIQSAGAYKAKETYNKKQQRKTGRI